MESLTELVVRHFDDSLLPEPVVKDSPQEGERQGVPVPDELILGNQLGDNRMLVDGGLLDQPYMLWMMANHARWVWALLERYANRKEGDTFDQHEEAYIRDVIDPIRRPHLKAKR